MGDVSKETPKVSEKKEETKPVKEATPPTGNEFAGEGGRFRIDSTGRRVRVTEGSK